MPHNRCYEFGPYHLNLIKRVLTAVETLELTDGEALLAEAMTISGIVAAKRGHHSEAKEFGSGL